MEKRSARSRRPQAHRVLQCYPRAIEQANWVFHTRGVNVKSQTATTNALNRQMLVNRKSQIENGCMGRVGVGCGPT